jgi:hypothetical protein
MTATVAGRQQHHSILDLVYQLASQFKSPLALGAFDSDGSVVGITLPNGESRHVSSSIKLGSQLLAGIPAPPGAFYVTSSAGSLHAPPPIRQSAPRCATWAKVQ